MSYIGNTVQNQNYVPAVDFFSGNGSTTAFTLSRPVASVAAVQAVISNVPQDPGTAFTVSGSTITFTSAPPSGTNNIYVYYTSPNTQVVQPGQGTVSPSSLSTGGPYWNTSGNVGIGTSSLVSGYRLNVVNDTGNSQQLIRAGTNYNSTISFGDQDSSTSGQLIYAHNGDYMRFDTNATERMRIDSSGNVGIGTSSPSAKLNVYQDTTGTTSLRIHNPNTGGGANTALLLNGDSGEGSVIVSSAAGGDAMAVRADGNLSGGLYLDTFAAAPIVLRTNATERMRIDSSGNLLFNSGYGSVATAYGCRAWVNFNGTGTVAIRASGNVTSITDNGTGDYTVNFTNAMPDVNYGVSFANNNNNAGVLFVISSTNASSAPTTMSTTQLRIYSQYDVNVASVSIFR